MSALACLLCGLYLQTGLSVQRGIDPPPGVGRLWNHDITYVRNPYAQIELGYEQRLSPRFSGSLSLSHRSSIATGRDHGINAINVSVRFTPWVRP